MTQSDFADKLTKVIKSIDKLTRDIRKDTQRVLETLKELREMKGDGKEEKDI